MENEEENICSIKSLPYEIITMILQNADYPDIVNFGSTCKVFYEMVKSNRYLWKENFKCMLPKYVFNAIEKHNYRDWLDEIKAFYKVKKEVYSRLLEMSSIHYWHSNDLTLEDVRKFFCIALSSSSNYYYAIRILQDVIKQGYHNMNKFIAEKPYTLTDMFYAKGVLRYLINTYLAIKWTQANIERDLHPEIVLNVFLQWVDPLNLHCDEEIECAINDLVGKAESLLLKDQPSKFPVGRAIKEKCINGLITEKEVLAAVTQVIYQRHMAIMPAGNLDTLDIIKVLKNRCGHEVAVAVIYQAVAKKLGVRCDLIAFPNHFFLQWRNTKDVSNRIYKINLQTGELQPKRDCPFSRNTSSEKYKYCPDSLLKYVVSAFLSSAGEYKTWYTQNAIDLLDFLTSNPNNLNPYRNFLPFLIDSTHVSGLTIIINLTYLYHEHLQVILLLTYLNTDTDVRINKERIIKTRNSGLKYAVGMICCHKKYDYICIIRDWHHVSDAEWQDRTEILNLEFGPKQPFYIVTAADQSERYVAQENLVHITQPNRLYHLEDIIAKEFTYFNGFSYVPNKEKNMEFPEDASVTEMFRTQAQLKVMDTHANLDDMPV